MNGYKIVLLKAIFMLYKLLESERVCSGICNYILVYLFICPPISSFLFFLFHYYIVCYKNKSAKISKRKYFYFSFR